MIRFRNTRFLIASVVLAALVAYFLRECHRYSSSIEWIHRHSGFAVRDGSPITSDFLLAPEASDESRSPEGSVSIYDLLFNRLRFVSIIVHNDDDLSGVECLSGIEGLLIFANSPVDISRLQRFNNLRTLTIIGGGVKDLSFICKMKSLRQLSLLKSDNSDLGPLFECKHLVYLAIPEYPQDIIQEVQTHLPNTIINF